MTLIDLVRKYGTMSFIRGDVRYHLNTIMSNHSVFEIMDVLDEDWTI